MRRPVAWVAVGLAAVSLGGGAGGVGDPGRPHAYMDDETRCIGCHRMEKDGEDWLLDPHLFTVSVVETCRTCHPARQVGRSHPVDVEARDAPGVHEVPEQLPLHWSDGQGAMVMTCGTCHNPHLDRLSPTKLWSRQRPEGGADT